MVTGSYRLASLRRLILKPRTVATKLMLTAAGLALATLVRWLLDRGAYGVPFLTFFPVLLFAALALGSRYAVLAAAGAVVLARLMFAPGPIRLAEFPIQAAIILLYGVVVGLIVATGHFVRLILLENQRHIELAESFNAELQHRSKNSLQVLRGLIGRGPAAGEGAAEFHAKLVGRMEALGRANELLRYGTAESTELAGLVSAALAPFGTRRFHCSGPDCRLDKAAVMPLVMALHELSTNALKYGALSVAGGSVALAWRRVGDAVALEWRESGGPAVTEPTARGMGSRLLRPHGGLTTVVLDWDPAGLVCRMDVAAENTQSS